MHEYTKIEHGDLATYCYEGEERKARFPKKTRTDDHSRECESLAHSSTVHLIWKIRESHVARELFARRRRAKWHGGR